MPPGWLIDAWKLYLAPLLDWLWGSLAFWQGLGLSLVTLVVVVFAGRRWLSGKLLGLDGRKHDLGIFQKLDKKANERFIDSLVNGEIFTLSTSIERVIRLWEYRADLQRIETRYLSRTLRKRAAALSREIWKLKLIVDESFFHVGNDRIKFYPDLIDRDVYDSTHTRLKAQIDKTWDAFRQYRSAIKERLQA